MSRSCVSEDDTEAAFLRFFAEDMRSHPGRIKPIEEELWKRACKVAEGIEVELDAPLPP